MREEDPETNRQEYDSAALSRDITLLRALRASDVLARDKDWQQQVISILYNLRRGNTLRDEVKKRAETFTTICEDLGKNPVNNPDTPRDISRAADALIDEILASQNEISVDEVGDL